MSEFGLKIRNYQAGSIYEYNLGVRGNYDYKHAMLSNSLFTDFLLDNGLNVWKNESTRDVICIEFNYGSRSFDEEYGRVKKLIKETEEDAKLSSEVKEVRLQTLNSLREKIEYNKDKYKKQTKEHIRDEFYTNGVRIEYPARNKNGDITHYDVIDYRMLYRTPGKAKKGSCMFINADLYEKAKDFLHMGLTLPTENSPIIEMGAYSSLVTSSIVDRIQIPPENILILKDVDSFFTTKVVSVETDEHRHCRAVSKDNYRLKNTLFDGQALIDSSIFPEWGHGYILLRHHLCKMAAFNSNIQLFFKDYFGEDYETAELTDMFGNKRLAKDVLLITTDNAIKWLKLGIPEATFDYWCQKVKENNSMFGIVKTAHKSKLGEVQRMSYQMVNALDDQIMTEVVSCSLDYIEQLKTNDDVFLQYLRNNANFSNDYEVLVALCEQDRNFLRSEYFRQRKKDIIRSYILNFKNGRANQNGDNLVIVGSPYAMLLHAAGDDPEKDDTFSVEDAAIQCYTERFADGEYLAEFRSPFNSKNNMGHLHNVYSDKMKRYFEFGEQIIAVNMIGTAFQDRNNGSDQDSDSIFTTNQPDIVEYAKYCYLNYPTIVNNIPKEKNHYTNTLINYSRIDNNLSAAQRAIGESSNLAQLCLTYAYNFDDPKYQNYVCILSVLAQVAIDNAKRSFDIDLNSEIARIKKDMDVKTNGYPLFWSIIRKDFNTARINKSLKCPMNFIYHLDFNKFRDKDATLPMEQFFVSYPLDAHRRKSKKVEELIQKYSLELLEVQKKTDQCHDLYDDYLLLENNFEKLISDIKQVYISKNYQGLISWLINRAFLINRAVKVNQGSIQSTINHNKSILLKVLYEINPTAVLNCFAGNVETKK